MGLNQTWDSKWFVNSYTKIQTFNNLYENYDSLKTCSNYSLFLHNDFLIRNYLNLIYSNETLDTPLIPLLLQQQDIKKAMSSSFFTEQALIKPTKKQLSCFINLTAWTHPSKLNLYLKIQTIKLFNKYNKFSNVNNLNKFPIFVKSVNNALLNNVVPEGNEKQNLNLTEINNKKKVLCFLDAQTLLNYNKLYISFLLNKQKYNIKLILIHLKSLYELRKRLYLINQALSFFLLFKYCSKKEIFLPSWKFKDRLFIPQNLDFFFVTQRTADAEPIGIHQLNNLSLNLDTKSIDLSSGDDSLTIFRKRLTRDYCLKINHKDIKFFLFRQSSFNTLNDVTNLNIKKPINITYLIDIFKKINNSLEKSYWIYYKYNIGWIIHNKNLYYTKTKIYNLCLKNINKFSINSFFKSPSLVANQEVNFAYNKNIYKFFGHFFKVLSFSPILNKTHEEFNSLNFFQKGSVVTDPKFFDSFLWFKIKNIPITLYYLHLIYIKFITLNLWKYLLLMSEKISRKKHKNYKFFLLNDIIKPLSFQIYTKIDRFFLLNLNFKINNLGNFSSLPCISSLSTYKTSLIQSGICDSRDDNHNNRDYHKTPVYPGLLSDLFVSDFSFFLQKIILFNIHSFSNFFFSLKKKDKESLESSLFLTNTKMLNVFYNNSSCSTKSSFSTSLNENLAHSYNTNVSYFSDKHIFSLANFFKDTKNNSYFFKIVPQSFRLFLTDLVYFFFQQKLEHFNTLKYISSVLSLRTDYVFFGNFTSNQELISQNKEHNKPLIHLSNNILSYCLKPLSFSNVYEKPCLFDQNFKRNSFYLSKIKDISKPLLYFGLDSSLSTDNKFVNTTFKEKKNTESSDNNENVLSLQKNISSFQIHSGPRVLIQKSSLNNKIKVEWHNYVSLARMDIDSYKKILISNNPLATRKHSSKNIVTQHSDFNNNLVPSVFTPKVSNQGRPFFNSRFISPFYHPFSMFEFSYDNINFSKKVISNEAYTILLTSYIKSYSKDFIKSFYFFTHSFYNLSNPFLFHPLGDLFNSGFFFNKNLSLFTLQKHFSNSIVYILPCLYNTSKDLHFNFFIKPFNFFTLKKSLFSLGSLSSSRLSHFTRGSENFTSLSTFLKFNTPCSNRDFSFISNYRSFFTNLPYLLTYSFFNKGAAEAAQNIKFLPLPKTPINELTFLYLKKFSLSVNLLDVNIKYYYSKTHSAYTFIENLSRFLIAFIKKNKGGKNKFQQLKNITYKVLQSLIMSQVLTSKSQDFLGIGFSYAGRVYGAKKAMSFKMLLGSVPFNTLQANIDYAQITQKTRNGTWGFQTWLHLRQKKMHKLLLNL